MGFLSRKTRVEELHRDEPPPPVAEELERMEEEALEAEEEEAVGAAVREQPPDDPPAAEAGASPQEDGDLDAGEREQSTRAESDLEGGGPAANPPTADGQAAEGEAAAPGRESKGPAANPPAADAGASSQDDGAVGAGERERSTRAEDDVEGPVRLKASDLMAPDRRKMMAEAQAKDAEAQETPEKTAEVIVFANQKGGVAKTTTTLNLAVAFAESGYRVLCIDLDPQGNLTMSQGIDPDKVEKSVYDVLVHDLPISEVIAHREIDIAVSSIDLAGAEIAMSTKIGRERSLEKALKEVQGDYDFVCIDTPPSLGLLTVNALTAADKVIVPVQCEYLSMRGLVQLQNTLRMIQENLNPDVKIEGILPTMLDSRTIHAKEAVEILEENFGDLVFKSRIRKAIKFAEAPVRGSSVLKYDPQGNAANYYRELAKEVLTNGSS
jgi:chromosome partitioning protein